MAKPTATAAPMAAVSCSSWVNAWRAPSSSAARRWFGELPRRHGAAQGVPRSRCRGGRDPGWDGVGDLDAVDRIADAAKDCDAKRPSGEGRVVEKTGVDDAGRDGA